jgi:isopenicillin N synthase-like dioxygenase
MSIPLIDLSKSDIAQLAEEVKDACSTWGFMYLKNHGIPSSSVDRAFETVSLSLEMLMTVARILQWDSA